MPTAQGRQDMSAERTALGSRIRIERVHLDVPAAQGKRDENEEESNKDAVKPRRFTEAAGSRY